MPPSPHSHAGWSHEHVFDRGNAVAERGTRWVVAITFVTMVVEIVAGWWYGSMALLADGAHMSSHVLAIGISTLAYAAARHYAGDPRFAFGTWKIEVLGGFASAILLLGVAMLMVVGSVERLFSPQAIHYREAIIVAVAGLLVNVLSALILGQAHHGHGHEGDHGHDHDHHDHDHDHHDHDHHNANAPAATRGTDLNLRSAYVHVMTDAATSVLAIIALAGGWWAGWAWLDPLMGIVGAVLVALWAKNLLAQTGTVLLDREMDHPVVEEIRTLLATLPGGHDAAITDLHVWRVGRAAYACALSVVSHDDALTPQALRAALAVHAEIVHATIEINRCRVGRDTEA